MHTKRKNCPAFGKICSHYKKLRHYEFVGFAKKNSLQKQIKLSQTCRHTMNYNLPELP